MAVAMDARGFATARHRTWAEPATWSRVDTYVLTAAIGFAGLPYAFSALL
jgi:energy-coupling factor transport system permease protein